MRGAGVNDRIILGGEEATRRDQRNRGQHHMDLDMPVRRIYLFGLDPY